MATRPISPEDIPRKANTGRTNQRKGQPHHPRAADVKEFLRSGGEACEIIIREGEKADHVYTALHNAIRYAGAEHLIRVTRRFDRIFLVRLEAPFSATGQTKFKG